MRISKSTLLVIIIVIFVVITGISKRANISPDTQKEVIKIGVIAPLSGEFADKGDEVKKGAFFAIDNINKSSKYKYELIVEDNEFSARKTATSYNKLVHQDNVKAVISMWSTTALVVAPLAQKDKIINFGIDNTKKIADFKYSHIISSMPEEHTGIAVDKFVKDGIDNIAVVIQNDTWGNNMLNSLKEEAAKENVRISSVLKFNLSERDFRVSINDMMKNKPQIIVLVIDPPALELFTKQLRELGYETPLTSFETFGFTRYKELYEGQWYTEPKGAEEKLTKEFKAKYNIDFTAVSAHSYNAVLILSKAIEKLDVVNADNIEESLKTVREINGATGYLKIDNSKIISEPTILKIIKNGKPILLGDE
jgi:branched-chain amino acid transport system substrate-binding protein